MTKNDLIKVRVSLLEYARHTGFEATESLRIIDAALAAPEPQPRAWMRKWAFDGDKPYKEKNANGRMAWSIRFKMLAVTKGKHFDDDVALYTAHRSRADRQGDE